MRIDFLKTMIQKAAWGAAVLLLGAGAATAQQQISLTAAPTTATLPDGSIVPMWGYFCGAPVTTNVAPVATCAAANLNAGSSWSPVIITVPAGQGLQINLTNNLPANGTGVPTSLMIVGQLGGGLGSPATYASSPDHANQAVTWSTVNAAGGVFTPPAQGQRVQSFGKEVAPGNTVSLTWTAPRPGTYLLESGTHPSIQATMGLIGMVVVTTAPISGTSGTAYPAKGAAGYLGSNPNPVNYNAEVPLILSEIDPNQNKAVSAAVNSPGFNEDATYGVLTGGSVVAVSIVNGGSGYSSAPTVTFAGGGASPANQATATAVVTNGTVTAINIASAGSGYTSNPVVTISGGGGTGALVEAAVNLQADALSQCQGPGGPLPAPSACYPPVVNYTPLYYLINGVAFSKNSPSTSVFPVMQGTATGTVTGKVLVRIVNAGARMHVPSIVGAVAPNGATGFQLIAEDGNAVPGVTSGTDTNHLNAARVQSEVFMAAGKTYDVMITAPPVCTPVAPATTCSNSSLAVYDRELSLSGNSVNRDSGMLAYIGVNGSAAPVAPVSATANNDLYNVLLAGQTFTLSDPSKGVIANDINVYGVALLAPPANGTVTLNTNGTFTYVPSGTAVNDTFTYCANGTVTGATCSSGVTATVTLGPESLESASGISLASNTFNAKAATYIKVPPPGLLTGALDSKGFPLTVVLTSITQTGVLADADGGFTMTGTPGQSYTFSFTAQNSQGVVSTASGSATVIFPQPSNLQVTVVDPKNPNTPITDYRWIIEEDKSFYIDPGCTSNPPPGTSTVTGLPCTKLTTGTVPILGVNFHTSDMTFVAQGCTGSVSCEFGQTVLGAPAVCDVGNGACRTTATSKTPVMPGQVSLDPTKRYYISVLPGDAANAFASGNQTASCSSASTFGNYAAGSSNCGHSMGGAPISFPASATVGTAPNPVTVLVEQNPFPPAKLAINVFEDDFPLNGEQDSGGGIDILATNEPSLGDFNIVLWDDMGGSGDVTGQMTYDMFNQPLGNSLDGTIDPATGNNACPITKQGAGITGTITVCPTYESDGKTLSPLAGQAVVANLMPGRFSVQAIPGADRTARGEEWLQTNTLDGQKAHDSFLRIGEPAYFQEFGPANYHVSIGFANPAIINGRLKNVCNGSDPNLTAGSCNYAVTGRITDERMSRTPDERLYSSGSYDAFYWTQCYVSIGDPDGEDFAFTKCDANGRFTLTGIPQGDWRVTVFDEWNDMIVDGLSTPVAVGESAQKCTGPKTSGTTCDMGDIATNQWQANVYTKIFIDPNETGVASSSSPGVGLVNTTVRYRDGSLANNLVTDLTGTANFNEEFPLFNWYAVETDVTRYKNTGTHTVYDAGGPADGSTDASGNSLCGDGTNYPKCGSSTIGKYLANTNEAIPLPSDLYVPGSIYCSTADCTGNSISVSASSQNPTCTNTGGKTTCSTPVSTGRIDNPWMGQVEGWQGYSGQGNFIEFGKAPYTPGENGGIHGHVVYASTRPFDDPQQLVQVQWEPLVPHVTMNLYKEGVASDGITPTLTLVDTTQTSSWDDWAQGFHAGPGGEKVPNMNCPGQSTSDLFYFSLANQPNYLDLYAQEHPSFGTLNSTALGTGLPYNSQFKCYDGMHNWNQLQPAVYDGMYSFPSITSYDATGKPNGTNCAACTTDPATDMYNGIPMLPVGKYVVEVVPPPGYEIVKEEDKNILIGDNYIAPVTQEFGSLSDVFILPDQASVASSGSGASNSQNGVGYNANNPQNSTQSIGSSSTNGIVSGFIPEPVWPCVGEARVVPDYISLFPESQQVAPFAGATRNLCDRKEVTLDDQAGATAKFYIYTSTHKAAKFTGVITDDFTSEFDPFSPQFGEKFAPPNMPISVEDWTGAEIGRVYSDWWGDFDGLVYSTWEVNPPNPTGYSPNMMVFCMNDKASSPTAATDPLYNPSYSQFCYELPYMPGQTQYLDTPVVPTSAFSAGYNHPDCAYPDATPAVAEVDGDKGKGPWASAPGVSMTITALGNDAVNNYGYSGPQISSAPYNQKTVARHYGFGAQCTSPTAGNAACNTASSVTIGGVPATITNWNDTNITITVPSNVPLCSMQQQAQYGGPGTPSTFNPQPQNGLTFARCGQLVITAGNGKQSVDAVTVTVGGKAPSYVTASNPLTPSGTGSIQEAIDTAQPGDLIMIPPGTYYEMLLMWKPVRLQGVAAHSVTIDANTQPAGKMDPWRRQVNCLFGLALDGTPIGEKTTQYPKGHPYDQSGTYTCGTTNGAPWADFVGTTDAPQVDRIPLEGIVGWDTTTNGNLAQLLQEPTLMGAYEGAGITVLGKGVNVPANGKSGYYGSGGEATFPTGTLNLSAANCGLDILGVKLVKNPYPSSFWCNPSRIDGLTVTDSSMGGGGIFTHAWTHNLEISNNRVYSNIGTLSGGINVGQGEFPDAYLKGTTLDTDPGSCESGFSDPANTQEPYCFQNYVNVHNNSVTQNTSIGDELFSGTPAGAGGVSFCTGSDYYKFNYNWVCGNMSTGDGGGVAHLGFIKDGDIEHNTIIFNQSLNPTIPTNGGGLIVMGAAPDGNTLVNGVATECGSVTDNDCVPGLSDGTGPGLVINANLFQGNAAEAGSGGGIRLQSVSGTEIARFPRQPGNWYAVSITNNIVTNNVAGWDGAGISLQDALVANIVNNTIASNDTTATAGPLTDTIGAPLASAPPAGSTTNATGTTSLPQAAGLVTMGNSPQLTSSFTTGTITCPANHGSNTKSSAANCVNFSIPYLANDLFWQNRAFFVGVASNISAQYQQFQISLFNESGTTPTAQSSTGQCVTGSSYWDIGARGDTGPGNHGSGVTLAPTYSLLTNASEIGTGANNVTATNPSLNSQYCNGSRVPPEVGGQGAFNVPPGISDATVPNPLFSLVPTATVDEGNNWINMVWGPLSLVKPSDNETVLGNYTLLAASPAIDHIPTSASTYAAAPTKDFFGNPRPDVARTSIDIGAVEYQQPAVAVLNVTPTSLSFGSTVDGTASAAQTLTLHNTGSGTATGIAVAVTAPFTQAGGTCGTTLTGGSTCTITVAFAPTTQTGSVTGTATITASVAVTGSPVSLSGTGATATRTATLTPSPYSFGTHTRTCPGSTLGQIAACLLEPTEAFTLTNTGNVAITVTSGGTIGGTNPTDFVIRPNLPLIGATRCSTLPTLNPGATCVVTVQFQPQLSQPTGGKSATLSVTDSAGTQSANLTGTTN